MNFRTDDEAKDTFKKLIEGATKQKIENDPPLRDINYFKRINIPPEPVSIAGTEYIGTARARRNHVDACIHYCEEQVYLKKNGIPIE